MSMPKTVLCKFYMNGFCKNGNACSFAHGQEDLIDTSKIANYRVVKPAPLCRNLLTTGECKFGNKCRFTHVLDDLMVFDKPAQMDPRKFKTKVCRHWLNGNCKMGVSCNFIHMFEVQSSLEFPVLQQAPQPKPKTEPKTEPKPKVFKPKVFKPKMTSPPIVALPVHPNYWDELEVEEFPLMDELSAMHDMLGPQSLSPEDLKLLKEHVST